jgi:hypothetical protein
MIKESKSKDIPKRKKKPGGFCALLMFCDQHYSPMRIVTIDMTIAKHKRLKELKNEQTTELVIDNQSQMMM